MIYNSKNSNLVKLKVKSKSLAAEARIIRKEERKALDSTRSYMKRHGVKDEVSYAHWMLRKHRIWNVRNEARATHLAIAFLKGRLTLTLNLRLRIRPCEICTSYQEW
jgi:outer membrane protein assembly factor BamD (BamD/ComL family)